MSDVFATQSNSDARKVAYAAVAKLKPESTSLIEYQSRGHVLIIAGSEELEALGDLPRALSSELLQFEGSPLNGNTGQEISIEGALGQFVVKVADQELQADLILDLSPEPVLSMAYKPPGYLHSGTERVELHKIKAELEDLIGTFEKPLYINYDESICAHSRSGKEGCTRCIDACPAEAITSLVDMIKVDTQRCHGGGICATVCPSSALTYAYPKPKDLLQHVRTLILSYLNEGESAPDLVFVGEEEQSKVEQLLPASLIVAVEEVASVGPEVWLSALAWGARSVRLFALDGMPESSQKALDLHLDMAQRILATMSYPKNSICVIYDESELITSSVLSNITNTSHAAVNGKRQAFYMALDHLVAQAEQFEPVTLLPEGSIFGEMSIKQSACTLCMACVSACPSKALRDGQEIPQVSFIEANCVQCGICVNTCPEEAISISARLLMDRELRLKPRVLHQDEPFCCISCGKPFGTALGINTVLAKLAGHAMFATKRSRDRLKMCDDCRVVDMMEDPLTDL